MTILRKFEFYLRITAAGLWMLFSSFLVILALPFYWKNPNLDHIFARILAWGAMPALGLRVRIENQSRLYVNQPCIYVANHQSNWDLFTYSGAYPSKTLVIGKHQLIWVPFFGIFFYGAGNIMINRKNRVQAVAGLDVAMDALKKKGLSIWIFPEGTRNKGPQSMLPFKKGAFHMAISAQVPVIPLVHPPVSTIFDYVGKRIHKGNVRVQVLEPIRTEGMTLDNLPALTQMVWERMDQALKNQKV